MRDGNNVCFVLAHSRLDGESFQAKQVGKNSSVEKLVSFDINDMEEDLQRRIGPRCA